MVKLKYFSVFLGAFSQSQEYDSSTVKCLSETGPAVDFGGLEYVKINVKLCQTFLTEHLAADNTTPILSDCDATVDALDTDKEKITCKAGDGAGTETDCPVAPNGCTREEALADINDGYKCYYNCVEQKPSCPSTHLYGIKLDSDNTYCFDKSFENTEKSIDETNDEDQLVLSCEPGFFEFVEDEPGYTLTFDKTNIVNTFTSSAPVDNVFECEQVGATGDNGVAPNGCACIFDFTNDPPTGTTTSMTCVADNYLNQCEGKANCKNNKCYNGQPIMDYEFNNCTYGNDEIQYCQRNTEPRFPCDNFEHDCDYEMDADGNKIGFTCQCLGTDINTCPGTWTVDRCDKKYLLMEEMPECDTKACFDEEFVNEVCTSTTDFSETFWQCFDDFEYVDIKNASTTNEYISATLESGSYEKLSHCENLSCPFGQCICEDVIENKANSHCRKAGNFFVYEKDQAQEIEETSAYEIIESLDFQCLSFSKNLKSYDAINKTDTLGPHECKELREPADNQKVECPVNNDCEKHQVKEMAIGFLECHCKERCSYNCDEKGKYKPVFNETIFGKDFDKNDSPVKYAPYKCEKDNLVMIICTSIFVPLGVFGIAGGVYFFFFYESSEVAPVETDNELGSTSDKTDIKEDEKTENQSEIQETTEDTN